MNSKTDSSIRPLTTKQLRCKTTSPLAETLLSVSAIIYLVVFPPDDTQWNFCYSY